MHVVRVAVRYNHYFWLDCILAKLIVGYRSDRSQNQTLQTIPKDLLIARMTSNQAL